jgi:hypothetical protein
MHIHVANVLQTRLESVRVGVHGCLYISLFSAVHIVHKIAWDCVSDIFPPLFKKISWREGVAVQLPPTDQSPTMGMVALLPKNGTETSALVIEFVLASWTGLAEVEAEQLRNLGRQTAQPPRFPRPRIYYVMLSARTCAFFLKK